MARIMSIDYGSKKTGLAVTDPLQIIVTPLITVETKDLMSYLTEYFKNEEVELVVVGEPFMADGQTPAQHHVKVMEFVKNFAKTFPQLPYLLQDETFSSRRAREVVYQVAGSRKKRRDKTLVDKVAAAIILQEYLKHI
ncbi:Holliday junction resolvase RuvX [Membranihabitans marinus]|uniref:Holliday junction resolvase RuvX n=1 Tax=Membranihabitans marinus TaxID=1227546 RepID=UPI001F003AFA|nr:Holliday junction resolvase RuvX [Membranihabitans marinus]